MADPPDEGLSQGLAPSQNTQHDASAAARNITIVLCKGSLTVNSAILSDASPVMRETFAQRRQGFTARSVDDLQVINFLDDDPRTMIRLCRLLHHQNDVPEAPIDQERYFTGAKELLDLLALSHKYQCTESIRGVGYDILSGLCNIPTSKDTPIELMLNLLGSAYLLNDPRLFARLSRCLVLDFTTQYSLHIHHPAFACIPHIILLLLEEQRKTLWGLLRLKLPGLAVQPCRLHGCNKSGNDRGFPFNLARRISGGARFPPYWPVPNDDIDLRTVLRDTYYCGDVEIRPYIDCKHARQYDYHYVVTEQALRVVCQMADENATGLCSFCLHEKNYDAQKCEHRDVLQQWAEESDPFT